MCTACLQIVSYSARLVESLSDVVEGLNLSYSSSIKKGTVELSGSSMTVNENVFKSSDINAVVSVKVTNQVWVSNDRAVFQPMVDTPPGTAPFNDAYGDCYISGFVTGGEFTGILSVKVIDRSNVRATVNNIKARLAASKQTTEITFSPNDDNFGSSIMTSLIGTETTVSVAWKGGGQIKPRKLCSPGTTCATDTNSVDRLGPRFDTCRCSCVPSARRRMSPTYLGDLDQVQSQPQLRRALRP